MTVLYGILFIRKYSVLKTYAHIIWMSYSYTQKLVVALNTENNTIDFETQFITIFTVMIYNILYQTVLIYNVPKREMKLIWQIEMHTMIPRYMCRGAWAIFPGAQPTEQPRRVLSDILFRLGLIANALTQCSS